MKKCKKMLVAFLTICLFSSLLIVNALAAEEPYTYTVTISAGNRGTINGSEKVVKTELKIGDEVSFSKSQVDVTDSKYYVKGIRLSGRDNNPLEPETFKVTGDADYVVAYGIVGDMVSYTVNYQDESGNALAPSDTFYGNVGDKPVVAYQYIEHFVPNAYAMTKTLSENEAENVFTFIYHPGETGGNREEIVVVPGEDGTTTPGGASGGTNEDAGENAETGNEANDGGNEVENPDEKPPKEIVDLDDEEPPTSNKNLDEGKLSKSVPLIGQIAIFAGAVIALIILIVALKKRAK